MKEKIMAIALSMVMLLGGTSTAFASGSNDKVVSEDLAMAIAYDFLLSREENEDIIEKLPNDYNLILSKTIYDMRPKVFLLHTNLILKMRRILIMDILLLVRKKNMHLSLNTAFLMKKVF